MKSTPVAPEVVLLHGFTGPTEDIVAAVESISAAASFRHLKTPSSKPMSAAMTNCGALGWVSDARGYRYEPCDPLTGKPWPAMPALLRDLAQRAAAAAGWPGFDPDACLVNRYVPGARMGAHRDADERDFTQPYVTQPSVEAAWAEVYRNTDKYFDLYELAEELVDVEDTIRQWRFRHVTTVERVIGFKRGTGGTGGVSYLRKMLDVVLFPEIWSLRTQL